MVSLTKLLRKTFSSGGVRGADSSISPPKQQSQSRGKKKRVPRKNSKKKLSSERDSYPGGNSKEENSKEEEIVENETINKGDTDSENDKPMEQQDVSSEEDTDLEGAEDSEGDEEGEDFIGELVSEEHTKDKREFKTLSPEELISEQEKEIQTVADLLAISLSTSAMLLRHFQWRRERLMERYLENPEKTLKEAGLSTSSPLEKSGDFVAREISTAVKLVGVDMCTICAEDVPAEQCTALSCHHRFCNECWNNYLTIKINEGIVTRIKCPDMKCNLAVDENSIKKLVKPEVYDKFIHFITKSFVEDSNGRVKWCPQPNCGHAITADMINGTVVRCKCGHRFCFSCHREAHAPANCEQVKLWAKKCKDDSETTHWKYANTKDCPKCETPVEKNGGCNHMTCRQCKHEWCWVCIRPWKGHNDYYNCNKFMKPEKKKTTFIFNRSKKREKAKEREAARERNRLALERYLHFFERYVNHSHSQELEKQIRNRASSQVNELQSEATTSSELQYILDGTEELLECRNVLKYTYVFAYYLPESGPEKELFEYLQEDLEKTTEQLSETLESPASGQVHRLKSLNIIQLAKTRKANLLNAVEQGLTEGL